MFIGRSFFFPFHALAAKSVGDEPVGEGHASRSRLLLDFFIFALNLDLTIKVSTVFAKLPIAIAISRIPQTTTCNTNLVTRIKYNGILVALTASLWPATQGWRQYELYEEVKTQHNPQIPRQKGKSDGYSRGHALEKIDANHKLLM